MKKTILLLAIFTFCLCQISCEKIQNQNPTSTNEETVETNSEDKFVGNWSNTGKRGYSRHLDIRKEGDIYIIDKYSMNRIYQGRESESMLSAKLKDGSLEVNSTMEGRMDLSEQTNKLYFGGSEYTKE